MGDCLLEKTALNDDEESGKQKISHGYTCFIKNWKMTFEQCIICTYSISIEFSILSARKRGF